MRVDLHTVRERHEALGLAPDLEPLAREATEEFRDDPLPEGVVRRLFERSFEAPECVVVLARAGDRRLGVVVTAPLEDPLSGERVALVVLLHVDRDHRHRGLARRLVEAAASELSGRGLTSLAARAGHNDDALISMGERWGFTRLWELMLRE